MAQIKRAKEGMKGGQAKRQKTSHAAANTIKKAVKNYMARKTEVKELTNYSTGFMVTAGAVAAGGAINLVSEGTDYNNRIGRRITSKQIQVDFYVDIAAGTNEKFMVALVYDRQPEAGGIAYGTIWDTSSAVAGMAFKNTYTDSDRFHICWLEQMLVNSVGPANNTFRKFFKVPEWMDKCEFSGTTSQLQSGAFYVTVGSSITSGTNNPYILNIKYQFTDL